MHSIESRCFMGPENILFAGASVQFVSFTGWGSEGVNAYNVTRQKEKKKEKKSNKKQQQQQQNVTVLQCVCSQYPTRGDS